MVIRSLAHSSSSLECVEGKVYNENIYFAQTIIQDIDTTTTFVVEFFVRKQTTLTCKGADRTKSYISRSNVHWRIGRRRNYGVAFCGGKNGAKGCKGRERCYNGKTTIHKSASGSIASHRGASDGKSTAKGDANGKAWIESYNKEKTHNTRQSYTSKKRY